MCDYNLEVNINWFSLKIRYFVLLDLTGSHNGNGIDEAPTDAQCSVINACIECDGEDFLLPVCMIDALEDAIIEHWCKYENFNDFEYITLGVK